MSFLAIDIGNTRVKWALYEEMRAGAEPLAQGAEFLEQIETLSEGAWAQLPVVPQHMLGCAVAADAFKRRVQEQMEIWPHLNARWVVARAQQAGLINGYEHPARLGADRWVAMIGARAHMLRQRAGRAPLPLVVVMVGTAMTVEAIDASGHFLGGFILPGHGIMLRALESGTSGLHVPTGNVVPFPRNTSDALTSGGTYAIAGAVQRMVQQVSEHCAQAPCCIMSGGAAWKMAAHIQPQFELLENLIFDGLLTIAA